jgi:hypothetical protein
MSTISGDSPNARQEVTVEAAAINLKLISSRIPPGSVPGIRGQRFVSQNGF